MNGRPPGRHSYRLGTAAESGGQALRVAFADFSAAPWQGFEKSERGPNNSSLFQPLAAVVVVAVQVLLSAVAAKGKLPCKTKKTVDSLPPGRHSYRLGTAH